MAELLNGSMIEYPIMNGSMAELLNGSMIEYPIMNGLII